MINAIPAPAWTCLPDGATDFLNQQWLDYTGLSWEESLGWGWKAAIYPDDLEKLMNTWLRLLASGEPGEVEARLRRFDGDCQLPSFWPGPWLCRATSEVRSRASHLPVSFELGYPVVI
jgi:PAS domain-containing protein